MTALLVRRLVLLMVSGVLLLLFTRFSTPSFKEHTKALHPAPPPLPKPTNIERPSSALSEGAASSASLSATSSSVSPRNGHPSLEEASVETQSPATTVVGDVVGVPPSTTSTSPQMKESYQTPQRKSSDKRRKGKKPAASLYTPLKPGFNPEAIRECMQAGNMTQWFFAGTSHIRNLIEALSALLLNAEVRRIHDNVGEFVQPRKISGLRFGYVRDVYMQFNLTRDIPKKYPDIPAQFDAVVMGRYMWDVDANNTYPQDFYFGVLNRLEDIQRRFALLAREGKPTNLTKIFLFMPYALKEPSSDEPFLVKQLQCRIEPRILMYRRMARCAAHYANTHSPFSKSINGVQPPRVELFDTYEYTKSLPNNATYKGANHYHPQFVQSMLGQLFERHVCPGRNISGKDGFNADDALAFDQDPWAGVEEDCAEVFAAAAKKDAAPEYGPIGPGVMKGQMHAAPDVFDRSRMHLYRNYTPVNNATGELLLNGFRILPPPMRPIDKLHQDSFDRLARSCSHENNKFFDGHLLWFGIHKVLPAIRFYCHAKRAFENKEIVNALPTYMNVSSMNNGHWSDFLSLLDEKLDPGIAKGKYITTLRKRIKMCLFNLGGRSEDILDEQYVQWQLADQIETEWRFTCQCSGVFAPHLKREVEQRENQTKEMLRFCEQTWPSFKNGLQLKKIQC